MSKACNADNVIGQILAIRESRGLNLPDDVMNSIDDGGKANYVQGSNNAAADIFDESSIKGAESVQKMNNVPWVKRILLDQAGVDEVLNTHAGRDLVEKLETAIRDTKRNDVKRSEFTRQTSALFDQFEAAGGMDELSELKQTYYNDYKNWMVNQGGPLFQSSVKTGAAEVVGNVVNNTVKSSFTVALGNPLEVAIKLPGLYSNEVLPALGEWLGKGYFMKKIPELEQIGFYGLEHAEPENWGGKFMNGWEGLNSTLDIPWRNLVYLAGAERGGQAAGLKAVEEVLFNYRMANTPRQRWAQAGRQEARVISYGINSMKLSVTLLDKARKGDLEAAKSLAIMGGLAVAIGGPGALVPQPVEDFLGDANPLKDMKWGPAGLVQMGGVGRLGVAYDILNRTTSRGYGYAKEGTQAALQGDAKTASVDAAAALLTLMAGTKSPLGDAQFQKAIKLGRGVILDDLDDDLQTEAVDAYLPFLNAK